jgi:hypothetical protein
MVRAVTVEGQNDNNSGIQRVRTKNFERAFLNGLRVYSVFPVNLLYHPYRWIRRSRGSSTSRSQSPSRFIPSEAIMMAMPGKVAIHQ